MVWGFKENLREGLRAESEGLAGQCREARPAALLEDPCARHRQNHSFQGLGVGHGWAATGSQGALSISREEPAPSAW